jgi:pSer/pThr/pTyr-binding forkhead associated (FHA) protein
LEENAMAKLIQLVDDKIVNEYPIDAPVTIGRQPDNAVVIDNPAVSSHHACVFRDGEQFVVEDLQSTNGTFVNGTRISRRNLRPGDMLVVGDHTLLLDGKATAQPLAASAADVQSPGAGQTVFVDKRTMLERLAMDSSAHRKHQALLATLQDVEAHVKSGKGEFSGPVGVLRVVKGPADKSEYSLEGHTSIIGKANTSLVRLQGWFKPNMAVAITRNVQGYVATSLGGTTLINDQPMIGRHELKDGDVLDVSGLRLAFSMVVSR